MCRIALPRCVDSGMVKVEHGLHPMHAPTIGPAVDLVLFQSHRLANQNDIAAVCVVCDADIVLWIVRPALKDTPQSQRQSSKVYFFVSPQV